MPTVSNLDAHTGFLMRKVSNAVSQEFARKISAEGVTVAEWVMLRFLYQGAPVAPSMLARKMGTTKGAISKLADRLLAKDLIAREGNAEDKRGHSLSLTAAGAAKVPQLAHIADENDAAFFACLTNQQHAALRQLLGVLIDRHMLIFTPVD